MTKTIPLAEAKKSLSAIIRDVDEKYDRFAITKNGVNKAMILSSDEFEGIL
ncbi:MAG: type II toxin-antitoxin system Phd/YefM family antitoxin, partial [Candidatus Babeliaceae bacterium]|nr:type II toxin-antitoxin system Phd/YefM family antitoxin [Candidatus Babeliaceae bacterium]